MAREFCTNNITFCGASDELTVQQIKQLNYPRWQSVLAGWFLLLITVVGIIENSVVLYIYLSTKTLRSPTNTFIVALAAADLLMAVFATPFAAYSGLKGYWALGDVMCTFEGWFVYCFGLSSMYLLTAVSVDRYIVIAKPMKAAMITHKVATIAVGICFAGGLFWSVMPLLGWSSYGQEPCMFACGLNWTEPSVANKIYIICIFIFCFAMPVGIMIYSYYHVYMTVRNISRNTVWDMKSRVARRNLRIEKKMLKSIVMMCACFLVCWTPYAIMAFWQSFGDADAIPIVLTAIPAVMAKSELVWNPIIYVSTNKQFRKAFYATIPCSRLREKLIKHEEAVKEMESEQSGIEDTKTRTKAMVSTREPTTKMDSTCMTKTSSTPICNALMPSGSNPSALIPSTSNPNAVTPSASNPITVIPLTPDPQAVVPTNAGMPVIDC